MELARFAVAAESITRAVSFESQANQAGCDKQEWHGREQGNGGTHGDLGTLLPMPSKLEPSG
jgi:hypothetical protein